MVQPMDPERLKRTKPKQTEEPPPPPPSVSAGAVDKVIDLAFNPSREKIREMTIVDRMQGRMFPQLDLVIAGLDYCLEIAAFRQDTRAFRFYHGGKPPQPPNLLGEFLFRTAQWQKSVAGKNLERATDIALAETETRGEEGEDIGHADPFE